jgi:hypothetical protein
MGRNYISEKFMMDRFITASVWGTEAVKFRTGQEDNHEWQLGKNMDDEDSVLLK